MRYLKPLFMLLAGIAIGMMISRPFDVKAQDTKDPSHPEKGIITLKQITPKDELTLAPGERYLGLSCLQGRCVVATMK